MSEEQLTSQRSRRTEAEWRALLDEMTRRGMSVSEAAREFKVGKQSLYNWQKKFSQEGQSMEFREISSSVPQISSFEIHCKGGH